MGWDELRKSRHAKMKELGVVDAFLAALTS